MIILAPYWVSYYDQIILAGGKPVVVEALLENDFKIKPSQLESAITGKTRLIIFNSPSNPTGMVYTGEEMEKIARIVKGLKIRIPQGAFYIMSDISYYLGRSH